MTEGTKNALLVSLEQWKAIRDEVEKTIAALENSLLAAEKLSATKSNPTAQPAA